MNSATRLLSLSLVPALVVTALLVAPAPATPPGKNGRIAFTRYATGDRGGMGFHGSIFTIGVDGKGERRVTRAPVGASDEQPDWSLDGSRIVFRREFDDKPGEIWSVRPDGSDLRQLDPGCPPGVLSGQICGETNPAWSPNGEQIAFDNAFGKLKRIRGEQWIEVNAIAVMDADGSNRRQLTQRRRPTSSEDHEPVWSPDGTRIAFMRWNSTAAPQEGKAIFVVNADGSGVRQVTPWRIDAGDHPDWSPDGSRILFRAPWRKISGSSIYTIRPDGTGLTQLTNFVGTVEVFSSSYSPDGKWIVFARSGRGGLPDLFVMRSDGTGIRQLTRTARWDSGPDWGPAP